MDAVKATNPTESRHTEIQNQTYGFIIGLSESDRPSLAGEMIVRTILDNPQSSSWHRILLGPRFLQRLSANQARVVFTLFSEEILSRLEPKENLTQKSNIVSDDGQTKATEDGPKKPEDQPYVKVITLKLLAELLRESKIVSKDFALSILSSLFQKSKHIDVRLAIFKSLLNMLESCPEERTNDIITALEPIIPLAGTLNERQPVSEDDWTRAEDTLSLPEVVEEIYEYAVEASSPILSALMDFYRSSPACHEKFLPFVQRILLPTVNSLMRETAKWTSLFLRKHGAEFSITKDFLLPKIPRSRWIFQTILSASGDRLAYVPRDLLVEYVDYLIFNIEFDASLRALDEKLMDDPQLKSSAEVVIWRSLYQEGPRYTSSFRLMGMVDVRTRLPHAKGITPQIVQEQYIRLFKTLVWNDTPLHKWLLSLVNSSLAPNNLKQSWWEPYGKPILENMITYIDTMRTAESQNDGERKLPILPDTFPWHLRMIEYPWANYQDSHIDRERKCEHLASNIAAKIDECSGIAGYKRFDQIKSFLSLDVSWIQTGPQAQSYSWGVYGGNSDPYKEDLKSNRLVTATYLGDITGIQSDSIKMPEMMRIEIASHLLGIAGGWKDEEKELQQKLAAMMQTWKVSDNEEIRRMGYALVELPN